MAAIATAAIVVAGVSWAMSHRESADDSTDDAVPVSLDAPVAMDPDIRTGTLDNGLRYYVRANDNPEARAELRLVVNAGSVNEDDDQRGLAHAVEHMAFRGTTRFPGRAIDEYLQSVGMRLGEDLNATTSLDETIYRLTIPTERRAVLDSGLTILAEWAHAVTFDSVEAQKERLVVFEEWRSYRNADERLDEARDSLLLRGSRYAHRRTIGDTATLRRFDLAAMRRFYRDWYRPDLMAVIAVGDFDAGAVEKNIRRRFSEIPASTARRAVPAVGAVQPPESRVTLVTDPEIATTRVSFWFPRRPSPQRDVADYRSDLVARIGRSILRDRLEREAQRSGSPLLSAGVATRQLVRSVEGHVVGARVADDRTAEGVAALGSIIARLRRFGPKESEIEGAKESLLSDRRDALNGAAPSADIADGLVDHYLGGDPVPSSVSEYKWTDGLLAGIGARDVTAFIDSLAPERSSAILVASRAARARTTREVIVAALDSATADVADDKLDTIAVTLMAARPRPGAVSTRRTLGPIDVQEWRLANGMRVLLKPTRFEDDAVHLRLAASGGASLAALEDYPSAYLADNILEATGAGDVTGYDIARFMDDRSFSLSPTVSDEHIALSGEGRLRDLEAMLQLTHLYLTAPRADDDAFRRYQERLAAYARNRAGDPDAVFDDSVASALRPNDVRALHGTARFVEAVDLHKAIRFWRDRTANAANFTAVIVGDFEVWQVSPLIESYLATLPGGHPEKPASIGLGRLAGTVERSLERGIEPNSQTRIVFGDTLSLTLQADADLGHVRDLLDLVLQQRLREELGGTYGVSVDLSMRRNPEASYLFSVEFTADPARVDSLARAALAEVERLRTRGPTAAEAANVREAAIRHNSDQSRGNGYWTSELSWHSLNGWSLESIARHPDDAEAISAKSLTAACARYLDGKRFVRVTRVPETTKAQAR
jgi:zinc protease